MTTQPEINGRPVSSARWLRLILSMVILLFAGVIYAWSILKAPLAEAFGWSDTELAFNYTLTMCFFITGILIGGLLDKRTTSRTRLIIAAIMVAGGFLGASRINGSLIQLYVCYGLCAGTGIGVAYNTIITLTNRWFPDRKGISTGCMMLSFGFSALLIGKVAGTTMNLPSVGWQATYMWMGLFLGALLLIAAFLMKLPPEGTIFPEVPAGSSNAKVEDVTTSRMLRKASFWKIMFFIITIAAIGNTMISFARDYALSVGASESLAVTLVGLLSIFNGFARLVSGAIFDKFGIKAAKATASAVSIAAVLFGLSASYTGSLFLGAASICMCGFTFGFCPSLVAEFSSAFYGEKHFALNFGVLNAATIPGSFFPTVCSALYTSSGSYVTPFFALLGVALAGLVVNLTIKKA